QPAELAGILTGVLLVATIILDHLSTRARTQPRTHINAEENELKNSQIAVLSGVILLAALIVTGSNWMLISSLRQELRDLAGSKNSTTARKPVIAMMPKRKAILISSVANRELMKPRRSSAWSCCGMARPISIPRSRT